MAQQRTIKAYENELTTLRASVVEMAGRAESQFEAAMKILDSHDNALARDTVAADKIIDAMEVDIEKQVVEMLALRSPVADDLREIISALKMSSLIERIADYAKNIAKRASALSAHTTDGPFPMLREMGRISAEMLRAATDAYIRRDTEKALAVWRRDQDVDRLYDSLVRELLTYMMENPAEITPYTHHLFIAKNIERIGDQATNLAEIIFYLATGEILEESRPKADKSSYLTSPAGAAR